MEELLASKVSFVKYPFRVILKKSSQAGSFPARIAVSVGKKRFKSAVKRNRIKRLVREAFRLNKSILYDCVLPGETFDLLFIYLDCHLPAYAKVEKAMKGMLQKMESLVSSLP